MADGDTDKVVECGSLPAIAKQLDARAIYLKNTALLLWVLLYEIVQRGGIAGL